MRAAFALFLCVIAAWGQAAPGHQRAPSPPSAANKAGAPKLSDAQLEAAIRAKFAKSKSASGFTVHVQGGVATIEGKTDIVQHKGIATRMAKTAGAVAVNNRVQVSDAGKKKAAGNLEEGRRRVQVKRGEARDARK
jgi:BON domain